MAPFDPQPGPVSVVHQRSRGRLRLSFKAREGRTVLDELGQEGCLKARLPRPEAGAWYGAVTLNTAGGVTGGDVLTTEVVAGAGTRATVAAQAMERVYRALPGAAPARLRAHVTVAPGAALEWLPQETILFDGCALDRELVVEVGPGGSFTGVEHLLFGRGAMGETVRTGRIRDAVRVRRGGEEVLHDAVRLEGAVQAVLDRRASAGGARAVATVVHAAPGAAGRLEEVRGALAPFEAGASCWDDLLVARVVAADGVLLRAAVVAVLAVLRGGRPLPRVWTC